MTRYGLLLGFLLLLAALLGLPPRHYQVTWVSRTDRRTPERSEFLELHNRMLQAAWLHQRIQWRDSVAGALQALDPRETPYLLATPQGTPEDLRARLDSGIANHLRALGASTPGVPVGVFLIPRDEDLHPAVREDRLGFLWSRREFYVGREGETPFCALVVPVGRMGAQSLDQVVSRLAFDPLDPTEQPPTLRLCGYFARYGAPGMEILNWLKGGGALFGQRTGLDRRLHLLPHQGRARGPFGLWTRYLGISPRGMACLAGVEETCRAIFLRPGRERDSWRLGPWSIQSEMGATPVDFFGSRFLGLDSDLGSLDEYVLDLLEQDFGRDRFRTFWQSSLPVPDAFQSAFGVSPEHWIMKLGRSHFGSMDRGPGVPLQASLLTLLTLGILLGAASRAGRYRS